MTFACSPDAPVPSLEAVNSALQQLELDAKKLAGDEEMMIVRRRVFAQKLTICLEALRMHIPDGTPKAPDGHFPELNPSGD